MADRSGDHRRSIGRDDGFVTRPAPLRGGSGTAA
jgi:hypothetical protein